MLSSWVAIFNVPECIMSLVHPGSMRKVSCLEVDFFYRNDCNAGIKDPTLHWPGKRVPYYIHPSVQPKAKIGAKCYQNKVFKHLIKESRRPYSQGNFVFDRHPTPSHTEKSNIK
ncbi:hypothetical protein TNCV_2508931 [Trichonephila clavipes]|nr:hypothetical protein TNCV_2508931 [Trichonephila clavipes]